MNLFWQTRQLTALREDHLTYFLAAALEKDAAFRAAYERVVLINAPIGTAAKPAQIASVACQVAFPGADSRADMVLTLADSRRVLCEHKLDAPEGIVKIIGTDPKRQLEKYLRLPVDAVAYFRPMTCELSSVVQNHAKYLRPNDLTHFLWDMLYEPLQAGTTPLSCWLADGFKKLGFTPRVASIGQLWPDGDPKVKGNQTNFAKFWGRTRMFASTNWRITTGRRCQLARHPLDSKFPAVRAIDQIMLDLPAQGGTLLRLRVNVSPDKQEEVLRLVLSSAEKAGYGLEAQAGNSSAGLCVDADISLTTLLGEAQSVQDMEDRLYLYVHPILTAIESYMKDGK